MASEVIRTPDVVKSIRQAIKRGLQQGAQVVKNYAVANVSGAVLRRKSGKLASSIRTRVSQTRSGGILRIGTKVEYGGWWEFGYYRFAGKGKGKGKHMPARPWLRPAAEQATPQIAEFINAEVDRELKAAFGNVTIEIKLS